MYIISQNKDTVIDMTYKAVYMNGNNLHVSHRKALEPDQDILLGTYDTDEIAMQVLEKIFDSVTGSKTKFVMPDSSGIPEEVSTDIDSGDILKFGDTVKVEKGEDFESEESGEIKGFQSIGSAEDIESDPDREDPYGFFPDVDDDDDDDDDEDDDEDEVEITEEIIEELLEELPEEDVKILMEELDEDGDGEMSVEEFNKLFE